MTASQYLHHKTIPFVYLILHIMPHYTLRLFYYPLLNIKFFHSETKKWITMSFMSLLSN